MHTTAQLDSRAESVTEALRTLTLPAPAPPLPRAKLHHRLALRLGLALLLWSARHQQHDVSANHAYQANSRLVHSERARLTREFAAQRRALLGTSEP